MIDGQISLMSVLIPPWIECFKTCRHFDSHAEFPPDQFPVPGKIKRCTYCLHNGTGGEEMLLEETEKNTIEMYCLYYEERND